jgi:hypothetical protein
MDTTSTAHEHVTSPLRTATMLKNTQIFYKLLNNLAKYLQKPAVSSNVEVSQQRFV